MKKKRRLKLIGKMGAKAVPYRMAELLVELGLVASFDKAAAASNIILEELTPIIRATLETNELKELRKKEQAWVNNPRPGSSIGTIGPGALQKVVIDLESQRDEGRLS